MKIKICIISNIVSIAIIFMFSFAFINKAEALTLSPARLELKGDPGATITKDISLLNNTQAEITYYSSFANFEAQGETGSPLFVEPKNDLGTWMKINESITLKAGETKTIPLTINIPKDAYAGGHFAVVFFGNNPNNGGQVSVGAKTGTLILLTVSGDILEAGGLSDFDTYSMNKEGKYYKENLFNTLPVNFQYRWKNDGNDRVKPEGSISIRSLFFIPVAKINANKVSGNILPHSTRMFEIDWVKNPSNGDEVVSKNFINRYFDDVSYQWKNFAVGPYLAHLDLAAGREGLSSSKNAIFFVCPWQLLILIVIAIMLIFCIGRKLLHRYNQHIINKARLEMNYPEQRP